MYRFGHCGQCQAQVMVKDTNGVWNSRKPNFRRVDLVFGDGHIVPVVVCKTCAEAPSYQMLIDNLTSTASDACDEATKQKLSERGVPVSHVVRK